LWVSGLAKKNPVYNNKLDKNDNYLIFLVLPVAADKPESGRERERISSPVSGKTSQEEDQ